MDTPIEVDLYTEDSIMIVKNVGEFKGKLEIAGFWTELTKTANHIEYSNTNIKVIDETTVHLDSDWKMNIGEGVITLEEWKKQNDGSWKLTQDEFEVLKKLVQKLLVKNQKLKEKTPKKKKKTAFVKNKLFFKKKTKK